MNCEIVIAKDPYNFVHPDENKDRSGVYKKGYFVSARENPNDVHSDKEKLFFTFIRVSDADADELNEIYEKMWELEIDYELVGSNTTIDGHRFRLFSVNPGVSLRGEITLSKAQSYLDNWNTSIFSVSQNEIVIDIIIYDMLRSKGFWDREEGLQGLTASELSYKKTTGIHTVQVDWSNYLPEFPRSKIAKELQKRILQREGIINSVDLENNIGEFSITRNSVLKWFRSDLFEKIRKNNVVYRRLFYIEPNIVDFVENYFITNGTGYSVTKAELSTYVKSMLDKASA